MIVRLTERMPPEDWWETVEESQAMLASRIVALDEQGDTIGVVTDFGIVPLITSATNLSSHVMLFADQYKIAHYEHRVAAWFDARDWATHPETGLYIMGLDEDGLKWLR